MPTIGSESSFNGGLDLGARGVLLSPDALKKKEALEKMQKLEEAETKRFTDISEKMIVILIKEGVTLSEYPSVVKYITDKVNSKVNTFTLDTILK